MLKQYLRGRLSLDTSLVSRFLKLIRSSRDVSRASVLMGTLGIVVALFEVVFLSFARQLHHLLVAMTGASLASNVLIVGAYSAFLGLSLILVYLCRKYAFVLSIKIAVPAIEQRSRYYTEHKEQIPRVFFVERERFAREILAPFFTILQKMWLPVFTALLAFVVVPKGFLLVGAAALFFAIALMIIGASRFRKYARNLDALLHIMSRRLTHYVDSFEDRVRHDRIDIPASLSADFERHASLEGKIDAFSQMPRYGVDGAIFIIVSVLGLTMGVALSGGDVGRWQTSLIFLLPLLTRSLGYFQATYKAFASINSNWDAMSFFQDKAPAKEGGAGASLPSEPHYKMRVEQLPKSDFELTLDDRETGHRQCFNEVRVVAVSAPSGFGKSTSIRRALQLSSFLTDNLELSFSGYVLNEIGYVSSTPAFMEDVDERLSAMIAQRFGDNLAEEFFGDLPALSIDTASYLSAGQIFRVALLREIAFGSKLIIIDESMGSVQPMLRKRIIGLSMDGVFPSLLVFTHSQDLLLECGRSLQLKNDLPMVAQSR